MIINIFYRKLKEKIKIEKKWDKMNKSWEQQILSKCLQDYEEMEWKGTNWFNVFRNCEQIFMFTIKNIIIVPTFLLFKPTFLCFFSNGAGVQRRKIALKKA